MSVLTNRIDRLIGLSRGNEIDAFAFVPGPNFMYLTGVELHLMERPTIFVISADGAQFAIMPSLEQQKWSQAMPNTKTFYWTDAEGPNAAFAWLADQCGRITLGVEGLRMRVAEYDALLAHWQKGKVVNADYVLTDLRILKDMGELHALRRAIEISEAALKETLDATRSGHTELQVKALLQQAMLCNGAEGFAFDPIVLTGAEAANPHGTSADRLIVPGACLLIDFGASYGGMHADITRTFFCQYLSDEHHRIYDVVYAANEAGKEAVKVGMPIGDVDEAATSILEASPYADFILHKTGHGLGHDIHETPQVMRGNDTLMEQGMVFTIEPGLYKFRELGVRIEDNIHVGPDGVDCMTSFDREIQIFG
ncbi:MAG: Xaa-Pro peptidase family protein [Planktomarina sp.]|nr:Xaa-Pro peptidase family protein [Planktomarina sp.]